MTVGIEKGVDERQLGARVKEKRVYPTPSSLSHAVNAGCDLHVFVLPSSRVLTQQHLLLVEPELAVLTGAQLRRKLLLGAVYLRPVHQWLPAVT
jgi:hypothetical protein